MELNASLLVSLLEERGHFTVCIAGDVVEHFHNRHLATASCEIACHFQPYNATANDCHRLGDALEVEDLAACHDAAVRKAFLHAGDWRNDSFGTRGDDEALGIKLLPAHLNGYHAIGATALDNSFAVLDRNLRSLERGAYA